MTIKSFISTHTIKSSTKDIAIRFIESEEKTRETAKERGYEMFDVELILFEKIGFRRYLVAWRVIGKLREHTIVCDRCNKKMQEERYCIKCGEYTCDDCMSNDKCYLCD